MVLAAPTVQYPEVPFVDLTASLAVLVRWLIGNSSIRFPSIPPSVHRAISPHSALQPCFISSSRRSIVCCLFDKKGRGRLLCTTQIFRKMDKHRLMNHLAKAPVAAKVSKVSQEDIYVLKSI